MLLGFVLTLFSITRLGRSPEMIVGQYYPSVLAAERMKQTVQTQQNAIMRKLLSESYGLSGVLDHTERVFRSWLEKARSSVSLPDEPAIIDSIETEYQNLQALLREPSRWSGGSFPWESTLVDAFDRVANACDQLGTVNFVAMNSANTQADREVRSAIVEVLIIAACTLLIGFLLARRLSVRLSTPMEQLAEAAQQVAGGNYNVSIADSPMKEVSQLASQFNSMTEALRNFDFMNLERTLNEQRQSEAVLQSIDDGLVIFDQHGNVVRANQVAVRQLGIAPDRTDQTVGQHAQTLFENQEALASAVERCLDMDTVRAADQPSGELEIAGDVRSRYLEYSVMPIVDKKAGRQGAVMVLRDITEHKAFDQMRTEFVMRASHELRTPVTSIRMGVGMLGERKPFAEGTREQDLWETVNEELTRLMQLVNDLFDLSRFQADRQKLEFVDCEVGELLGAVEQRFALSAAEKGVDLAVKCADTGTNVKLDLTMFNRVLDNLVSNAIRHTPGGGVVVLGAFKRSNAMVVQVSDDGVGIDFAQQKRVFEPFVQVSGAAGGAGLGLAICKEIVQLHGGQISVRSTLGQGSEFTIALPC